MLQGEAGDQCNVVAQASLEDALAASLESPSLPVGWPHCQTGRAGKQLAVLLHLRGVHANGFSPLNNYTWF
jgi:hypothetical protein